MNIETLNTKIAFKVTSGDSFMGYEKGEIWYLLDKKLSLTKEKVDRENNKIIIYYYEYLLCNKKDGFHLSLCDEGFSNFLIETDIFIEDLNKEVSALKEVDEFK